MALPWKATGHNWSQDNQCRFRCLTSKHRPENWFPGSPSEERISSTALTSHMDRSSLDRSHRPAKAGGHLWRTSSPTPDQSRSSCSKLLRAVCTQDLSISMDGDYTAFLGNLSQCLNTPQKSFSLHSNGFFLVVVSAVPSLSCLWIPMRRVWLHLLLIVSTLAIRLNWIISLYMWECFGLFWWSIINSWMNTSH